jgi:subtilisin family serine protease
MTSTRLNLRRLSTLMTVAIATLAGSVLVSPPACGAEIHPALLDALSKLPPGEPATAIVALAGHADLPALDAALRAAHATRQERHRRVVAALRSEAQASQAPIVADLDRLAALGEVESYKAYWIANVVVVRATRAGFEELAGRPDVASIDPAPEIVLDPVERSTSPAVSDRAGSPMGSRGIGSAQGLRAINAPRVWRELGVNGSGAVIGILDTGTDGNHPALRNGWRGNHGNPWQECWHDVVGSSTYPNDDASGHGTHVAGTTSGIGVATGDTIGVAWGAQWIAANLLREGLGSEFLMDLFDCFQWFIDPDGDPGTIDDVPDVVLSAWGVNESLGFPDCDSSWWPLIDACEAAGIVMVWAAGGDGPGAGTIRSPADRATTVYNAFSVGAVDAAHYESPYVVTSFSSRGPSGCSVPAPLNIKPEVVAPGVDIYSSYPGGSYQVWSGTAMASAHVAGAVALLRAADPDLEVDAIKEILMATARDGGAPGEDNSYGWGTIDAYAAVAEVRPPAAVDAEGGQSRAIPFLAVAPNPFTRGTSIRFALPAPGPAALRVYDAGGRLVRTVFDGPCSPGKHAATWDGRDASGRLVPAGVYFTRLSSAGGCERATMLLLR